MPETSARSSITAPGTRVLSERQIEQRVFRLRGEPVMLDSDLATLYGVPTSRLNEQVRRNLDRFPLDFMFQLTREEAANLISQFAISSSGHGGRRKPPLVFTEQGVAMLSSVLKSKRAVQINIAIMRAFVRLRQLSMNDGTLGQRVDRLETAVAQLNKETALLGGRVKIIFTAIEKLSEADEA